MGKSPDKLSYKFFSIALLLLLVSCGRANQVSAPEDPVDTTAETESAAPTPAGAAAPDAATPIPETAKSAAEQAPRSAPVALAKQDCGQMVTQTDMNQCAAENYGISDNALNQVYQSVRQGLDDAAKAQLTTAEEQWIVFRDAQCRFESDRFQEGSMAPLIQASCMEQITDNRIAELQQTDQTETSYAEADAQLNEVYQAIQALLSDADGETLVDVQLSWLDYRDAHCEFEANLPAASGKNACLAAVTETRVWQLQALQDELSL